MIILFGVVGSGKSEQAIRLVAKLKCPYISTSDLIRKKNNPIWNKLITAGQLLPDNDIIYLLETELRKFDASKEEFILDGAPRSIGQAEWLNQKVQSGQIKVTAIIHLKVTRETTIKRLLNRGRYDDNEEVISKRFQVYESITMPVLAYLKSQGYPIIEVDGEWSAEIVEKQTWAVLEDRVAP